MPLVSNFNFTIDEFFKTTRASGNTMTATTKAGITFGSSLNLGSLLNKIKNGSKRKEMGTNCSKLRVRIKKTVKRDCIFYSVNISN